MRRHLGFLALLAIGVVAFVLHQRGAWRPLPGRDVYDAGRRLGWTCRPDPFQELGCGFYFLANPRTSPPPNVFLRGKVGPGVLHVRRLPKTGGFTPADQDLLDGISRNIGGWNLHGDVAMADTLARELD
jgi:hypothetical protein